MNAKELAMAEKWMKNINEKYPETKEMEFNIFGRFIQGYRYNEAEVTQRFETFYQWYK